MVTVFMRYDCVIVGSGPAGLEAAVNLKIRGKSFLLFGSPELSRKIRLAPRIQNYLGFSSVSGEALAQAFEEHLAEMGIEISPETVALAYPMGDYFSIATGRNVYESKTLILAPGVYSASYLEGEQELLGHGVGYCATCDAPLYKGKTVAILGYTPESVREANFVAELASRVLFFPMGDFELSLKEGVEVIRDKPVAIVGERKAETLVLEDRSVPVDGVFLLRESVAPDALLPGLALSEGFIGVDAAMKTNIPGCFAAGDCTGKPHQYMRAAGQGLIAAHSAVKYIDQIKD